MYTPVSNVVVNAAMRWPSLGLVIATFVGFMSENTFAQAGGWAASVALGTYIVTNAFGDHFCDCDNKILAYAPKVSWIIEHNPESGGKRPWELFSMFGDDESTKQHYASYSTEKRAIERKEILEGKHEEEK